METLTDARILIVDDQESNVTLLEMMLARQGYANVTSTTDSAETVTIFEHEPPDLLLLDLQMPHPDGFEVMDLIQRWTTSETYVPVLVLTADASHATRLRALDSGARDFVPKPFDFVEVTLRIRNLLQTRKLQLELQALNETLEARVRRRTHELEEARTEAFQRLGMVAEYRDDVTRQHARRVGITSGILAAELGLDPTLVDVIERIAPLHDIGKIAIPDAILLKSGKLTDDEFALMRTHVTIGQQMLAGSSSPVLQVAAEIALSHHERWDGRGYPAGLAGEAIPITGRIVALADAFDAMTHDRPYKGAMPRAEAVAEIERCAGSHFDPAVVAAFARLDHQQLMTPTATESRSRLSDDAWHDLQQQHGISRAGAAYATDAALEATFADTPTPALIADDHRRCVTANAAACEALGLDIAELRKRRLDELVLPEIRPQLDAMWAEFLAAGVQSVDLQLLLPDGTTPMATCHGVAHLLPGRHLSLLTPIARSALDGIVADIARPRDRRASDGPRQSAPLRE
jgi:putative two-component system response regulator